MSSPRSRFSRRHLLALCTFLVPLALLAVLGQSELQRQGKAIQAAISSEAQLFLNSAVQAFEQQFELQLPPLLDQTERLIAEIGTVRTTLQLREQQEGFAALLDIIIVDEGGDLVWPPPPSRSLGLPLGDERFRESAVSEGLRAADLLLTYHKWTEAEHLLQHLVEQMETAEDSGRGLDVETHFRLATVQKKLGRSEAARATFTRVRELSFPESWRSWATYDDYGAMAETALAEMGSADDRVALILRLANHQHFSQLPDGLRMALIERLGEGVPAEHPERPGIQAVLREQWQRAQSRIFAGDYEVLLVRDFRSLHRANQYAGHDDDDLEITATLGDATTLLSMRPATTAEKARYPGAARVGLHIDLDLLMAPALEPFIATGNSFVLSVHGKRLDNALVPAPETVPADYVAPSQTVHGMQLAAWPADAERLLAEADARSHNRVLLLLALFGAAMAGALWLWRSVSREAELATLKVDLVSRVSHELKTPLALIRMYGETLELGRARDNDQAKHFGGIIARESERLTTMIQRILDFSRQQAGTLSYAPSTVELGELLRRICDAYTPHLEARGAVLVDSVHADCQVFCDENACESAVINLLENAAKYGIEGDDDHAIELDLIVDATTARIEVRDRGRGIPTNECETVFDAFYRASNSGEVRGAGIGLSLVRHFARAHGGDVTATARDGGGVTFEMTLPLAGSALLADDEKRTP